MAIFDYLETGAVVNKTAQKRGAVEMFKNEIKQRYDLLSRLKYKHDRIIFRLLSNYRWELEILPKEQREALFKELSLEIDTLEMANAIGKL